MAVMIAHSMAVFIVPKFKSAPNLRTWKARKAAAASESMHTTKSAARGLFPEWDAVKG